LSIAAVGDQTGAVKFIRGGSFGASSAIGIAAVGPN